MGGGASKETKADRPQRAAAQATTVLSPEDVADNASQISAAKTTPYTVGSTSGSVNGSTNGRPGASRTSRLVAFDEVSFASGRVDSPVGLQQSGGMRFDHNALFPQLRIRTGLSAAAVSLGEMGLGQMAGAEKASTHELFAERTMWAAPASYTFGACGGQSGPIRSISSAADGGQFGVVVVGQKQAYIVDANTGRNTTTIKGHLDPVLCCAQSRDSKFLVTTSADCTVILWDTNNGKKLREVPVNFQSNVCAVSDDSEVVATTSTEDYVHLWDARACEPLYTFTRHSATIFSVAFSRRGNLCASGATNGDVMVWQYPSGDLRAAFARHRSSVLAVSFSHDGQRLVTVDKETLRCWDLFTSHCVFSRDARGNLTVGPEGVEERIAAAPAPSNASEDPPRFLTCAMVAGNLIVVTMNTKQVLVLEPCRGTEILSVQTKAMTTAIGASFAGDTIFLGDVIGNQYKLRLTFLPRDMRAFNLNAKPFTREKNTKVD